MNTETFTDVSVAVAYSDTELDAAHHPTPVGDWSTGVQLPVDVYQPVPYDADELRPRPYLGTSYGVPL